MPFYEYQCNHCGHTLEAMQKITDAPLKKCPHCGKPQLRS
jgi:putative FmdB family regulatory protein